METRPLPDVLARRLRAQHLARRAPAGALVEVARDLCGVQAQVPSAAALALWARVADLTPQAVEDALWRERALARTWAMRGTLHLLAAEDVPLVAAALTPHDAGGGRRWMERNGLTPDQIDRVTRAIVAALADGPLTRRALTERVVAEMDGPEAQWVARWVEHGWGGLVKVASQEGAVLGGPSQGQEATFVRRDHWLPPAAPIPQAEAEETLLRRYLRGYGPATLQDFAFWAGVALRDVQPIYARLRAELLPLPSGAPDRAGAPGKPGLLTLPDDAPPPDDAPQGEPERPHVRLLPSFDPYVLAYKDKADLVDAPFYKRVFRAAAWVSPVLLVDGRVAGVWSHRLAGRRLRVLVEPFLPPPAAVIRAVEAEADSLGRFLGATAELSWT